MNSQLLRSLFDEGDDNEEIPLTVTELNEKVGADLESRYSNILLEGEISNFFTARSGHWYFSLTDSESQIKAACFKGANWRVRFEPENGLSVRVRGKLSVYVPRGEYQITVDSLEPVGEGALKIAFEQVRARLEADGLFKPEYKRKLPYFPQRVGVVTSPNGAAFFDILNVLTRRTKSVSIVLIPSLVQGEGAPLEIRNGIELANSYNKNANARDRIDVLIVGRGGGSSEDLAAFNEEFLARAIFESEIPIISAVGHEIDTSIADMVADVRAPTPSAAAEIVAEREDQIEETVNRRLDEMHRILSYRLLAYQNRLQQAEHSKGVVGFLESVRGSSNKVADLSERAQDSIAQLVRGSKDCLDSLESRITPARLAARFAQRNSKALILEERILNASKRMLASKENELGIRMAALDAMSPLSVLERGYSLTTFGDKKIVRDSQQVNVGDEIGIRFAKGEIKASVSE